MDMIKRPQGTQDLLPNDTFLWRFIESKFYAAAESFGFKEIRTPTFEYDNLFVRVAGDTTDVVEKEMYRFTDRGERTFALKPEGTAGVVRAALENKLFSDKLPLKLFYITPCFRAERTQKGRFKEHHQFGVEWFGGGGADVDAQVIAFGKYALSTLGITDFTVKINSIGCSECRPEYGRKLVAYLEQYPDDLCETCKDRMKRNPLRVLDCKNPSCRTVIDNAPNITENLCSGCSTHLSDVQKYLTMMGVDGFEVDSGIVRGFDYYTGTVFEFVTTLIGSQSTILGGGRYDTLVESMGGKPTPGIGFGSGIERLILVLEGQGVELPVDSCPTLYIASGDKAAQEKALELAHTLRQAGVYTEIDCMERSLKSQLKYANSLGAQYKLVIGEQELSTGKAALVSMADNRSQELPLTADALLEALSK